jgi:catechol 2,3-dioxygenase-like lactoylglutathione lyase family enzyme
MHPLSLTPILSVSDIPASLAFFHALGWRTCWDWTPPGCAAPSFASVGAGEFEIFLCLDDQGARPVWLMCFVDDADALHRRCLDRGLTIARPPADEPWGVREFHLRHPDGHTLRIGHRIPHAPPSDRFNRAPGT